MAAAQASIRVVCLLSGPRTGSTRVLSLLGGFDRLYARAEIFNPEVAESLEAECEALGRFASIADVRGPRDPRLVTWLRTHPNAALDWLVERAAGKTFVFKLFPGHIVDPREQTRAIQRADVAYLIIRRRPIDIYVSLEKARITAQMRHADTTGIRIEGDVGNFLAMSERIRGWYQYCAGLIDRAGRPRLDLSYVDEIAKADDVTLAAVEAKLKRLGVDPGSFAGLRGPGINRQDRSASYDDKMSNWEAFSAALKAQAAYFQAFQE